MSQVPLDAPETKLSAIIDDAIRNSMGVANIRSRISVLLGSLRGAQENESEDLDKAHYPEGSLNYLHVVLSETESSVLAVQSELDELFSLLCSVADD